MVAQLAELRKKLQKAANSVLRDEGVWIKPVTAPEAHLLEALQKLLNAVELFLLESDRWE